MAPYQRALAAAMWLLHNEYGYESWSMRLCMYSHVIVIENTHRKPAFIGRLVRADAWTHLWVAMQKGCSEQGCMNNPFCVAAQTGNMGGSCQ